MYSVPSSVQALLIAAITFYSISNLVRVRADDRPFTYANQSNSNGYGLKSWDHVEPSQYYFDWTRYINNIGTSNYCRWDGEKQSPINISEFFIVSNRRHVCSWCTFCVHNDDCLFFGLFCVYCSFLAFNS